MLHLAIVGRPNVGKSTLFNRILGKKRAIVHDTPGVTRDWQSYDCTFNGLPIKLYDTPGIEADIKILPHLHVDLLLWVIDGKGGLTSEDERLARLLRKQKIPVILLVNKAESEKVRHHIWGEVERLGFSSFFFISALHGDGVSELSQKLRVHHQEKEDSKAFQRKDEEGHIQLIDNTQDIEKEIHRGVSAITVVVMGRPNVGKSTFVNRFLGYERMKTGPQAGITTDAVVTAGIFEDHLIHIVDTAGLRKSTARYQNPIEHLSCQETERALVFSHVAVVVMDASLGVHKQDLVVLQQAENEGRAIVVALNKWDEVKNPKDFVDLLPAMIKKYPIVPLSCLTGLGWHGLWKKVISAYQHWNDRLSTGPLNRWLSQKIAQNPPPLLKGHRIKIKYMTQVKTRPPTFHLFGYRVKALMPAYLRYLSNGLREDFGFATSKLICVDTQNPYEG